MSKKTIAVPKTENELLTKAVQMLFSLAAEDTCARFGGLSAFMYAEPNFEGDLVDGAAGFARLVAHPDYYLLRAGRDFLNEIKGQIALAFMNTFSERGVLCDLGPGPSESIRAKTVEIIQAIGIKNLADIVLVDKIESYLTAGWEIVNHMFHGAPVTLVNSSFGDIRKGLAHLEKVMYLLLGNTGCNFESDEERLNSHIIEFFKSIRKLAAATGGLVVIEQDSNQDVASLMAAYDNPVAEQWMKNLLHRMVRDAGVEFERPLDPEVSDFKYFARWNPTAHCMEMGVTSLHTQTIRMGENTYTIKEGTELHMWNSFKYPPEMFKEILEAAGFKCKTTLTDNFGRSTFHVASVRKRHMPKETRKRSLRRASRCAIVPPQATPVVFTPT